MNKNLFKNKYVMATIIFLVMAGAFVVRFYHFHDWLYFKMDQARDAFTISNAVNNGPGELPLLGPRAGATKVKYGFLRLGPVFYYLQYLSSELFHSTDPATFAYPDLFFGLAVIPLLYLFSRLYFSRLISFLITLLYSFSFIVVEYSRFAWNPNSLPFFTILSFYALLKFLNDPKEKHRKWWIMLWSTGLTIGSQLHFLGFFSLVGVSALLFIFHYNLWQKDNLKNIFKAINLKRVAAYAGIALAIFLIFYSPVIISDTIRHGENTKDFIQAFSSKQSSTPVLSKMKIGIGAQIEYYTLIATSYIFSKDNSKNFWPALLIVAIFAAGLYLIFISFKNNKDKLKKDFSLLIVLWIIFFFLLTIPVSDQIRPRYFIFTFAVPFILLGFIFEYFEKMKNKKFKAAIFVLAAAILAFNLSGIYAWFKEQAKSQVKHFTISRTLILKTKDGVTLGQLEAAADYIYLKRLDNNRIYYYIKPEHVRPLEYLLSEKNNPTLVYQQLTINADPNAQYFAIVPADYKTQNVAKKVGENFSVISREQFGQLAVWEINFPDRQISTNFKAGGSSSESEDRLYWKDLIR